MSIEQVAAELTITTAHSYALLRSGSLPALKIGGRSQWRVELTRLETWIKATYSETEAYSEQHPMAAGNVWGDEFGHPTISTTTVPMTAGLTSKAGTVRRPRTSPEHNGGLMMRRYRLADWAAGAWRAHSRVAGIGAAKPPLGPIPFS